MKQGLTERKRKAELKAVVTAVCRVSGIQQQHLMSARRYQPVARWRMIAFYVCYNYGTSSLPEIGAFFDKDHTTILHGVRKIKEALPHDGELQKAVSEIVGLVSQDDEFETSDEALGAVIGAFQSLSPLQKKQFFAAVSSMMVAA